MPDPQEMTAVEISAPGGPDVLRPTTRPVPRPGPGQILIRIAYAGVNRPDVAQRAGIYPAPQGASDLPGLEASGHVAALGEGVSAWQVGDAVTALLPGGGYAQYAVTDARHALSVPRGMSLRDAAGLCETFFTVWYNLFRRGRLAGGETLLVHGGTSGIGTTAIQLGRAFGARVIATAGSDAKCKTCLDLGAEIAINYRARDFVADVNAAGGADVVLDMVGGAYLGRNVSALRDDGRLVLIAFLEGTEGPLDILQVLMKRLTITGSTLRRQSDEAKAQIAASLRTEVWPLIEAGAIGPVFDSEFPLHDAAAAHKRMESSAHVGKIVLKV